MCLIVDANVATRFFCTKHEPTEELRRVVFSGGCCVVYGGQLRVEYERIDKARRVVLALDRAGRARAVRDADVVRETAKVKASGHLISDDPHIVALAQVTGSRLLHSLDVALHADFTNPKLINGPRGKVYQGGPAQRTLIKKMCDGC